MMNEEQQKALAKVKATVHIEGIEISLVTPRYHDAVLDFIAEEYFPDEPLGKALGLTWTDEVGAMFRTLLQDNLSLMAVTETGEIAGVVMSGKEKYDITSDTSETLRNLLEFFEHYSGAEVEHIFTLSTGRAFRRRGIATKLLEAVLLLGVTLGYKAFMVEASSLYTKNICIKHGFEQLAVLPYTDYRVNGVDLFKNREKDEHTSMTIYGKKIQSGNI